MSTYYWAVCDEHGESCPLCADHGGDRVYGDSVDLLPPFLLKHNGCKIRCINEHDEIMNDHNTEGMTTFDVKYKNFAMSKIGDHRS